VRSNKILFANFLKNKNMLNFFLIRSTLALCLGAALMAATSRIETTEDMTQPTTATMLHLQQAASAGV